MNSNYVMLSLDKKIPAEKVFMVHEKLKEVPDDKAAGILAYSNMKDPITSLILGIFLGGVGAHCFYLGEKKKGIAYAVSFGISMILMIIGTVVMIAGSIDMANDYYVLRDSGISSIFTVGLVMIVLFAIATSVIALVGLIDGVLSYKRTQEVNFVNLIKAIDEIK